MQGLTFTVGEFEIVNGENVCFGFDLAMNFGWSRAGDLGHRRRAAVDHRDARQRPRGGSGL